MSSADAVGRSRAVLGPYRAVRFFQKKTASSMVYTRLKTGSVCSHRTRDIVVLVRVICKTCDSGYWCVCPSGGKTTR